MSKPKILIVEDEALIALHLQMKLSQAGYDVCRPVARGGDAIEQARKENPAVILMDIRLIGEMDGIEAARQITVFSSAMIIFTSGYSDAGLKARALALNPAAYLLKPVDVGDIDTIIGARS
jgi:DNA-binding NarL/FixJ family response regulator